MTSALRKKLAFGFFSASVASFSLWSINDRRSTFCQQLDKLNLFSWGSSQYGQLGLGDTRNQHRPTSIRHFDAIQLREIAAGGQHSAALSDAGEVYAWGRVQEGRLGLGSITAPTESTPRLVEKLVGTRIRQVAIGEFNTAAVDVEGKLYVWGRNLHGQLGGGRVGGFTDSPVLVESLTGVKVKQVAVGRDHLLALTDSGEVYAFGNGLEGALGTGQKEIVATPTLVHIDNQRIKQVAAGHGFSLFLTENGQVYSCGADDFGQTGHGGIRYELNPRLVRGLSNVQCAGVAAGECHAAALTASGKVYTWGESREGQGGHGDTTRNFSPRLVNALAHDYIVNVACGGSHTAFLNQQGQLYMCGRGKYGQLGRGDKLESMSSYRTTPQQVDSFNGASQVVQVALGSDHTLALVKSS